MTGTAHGKVIVWGEHAVVYGQPAIAAAVDLSVTITLQEGELEGNADWIAFVEHCRGIFEQAYSLTLPSYRVEVSGNLPLGKGLGGSAAVGSALFQALAGSVGQPLDQSQLLALVMRSETFAHGRASGLDATTVVRGGLVRFQRRGEDMDVKQLQTSAFQDHNLWLIDSGKPQETTKDMVAQVKDRLAQQPALLRTVEAIGDVVVAAEQALIRNEFAPVLLTQNQRLLEELGVVGTAAHQIVSAIEAAGGYAKITGAGGATAGSGMILAYHPDSSRIAFLSKQYHWATYPVHLVNV